MTTPTSQIGLKAHVLRPAKGARLVIKDAAAFEPGTGFAMRPLTKQRRPDERAAAANTTSRMSGHYNGAELKPYQGRPGSQDFLALPSLMGTTRVYRKDQTTPEAQA
jgi:hypothetical protein